MATVLKQQYSLNSAFQKRAGGGLFCIAIGVLILMVTPRFVLVGGFLIVAGAVLIRDGYTYHCGAIGENRVAAVLARLPDRTTGSILHDLVAAGLISSQIVSSSAPEPRPGP
ncbi:MAG: hypothetical protein JW878_11195 [Methanomicrobia archaeon]|nr:hypothetical protein [Methanomicrobia archaeon]